MYFNTTIGVGMSSTNKHIGIRKCSEATKLELEKSEDILSILMFYILPIIAVIGLIAHYVVARVFIRLGLDVRYNVIMLVYAVGRQFSMFALIGYALPYTSICPYFDDEYSFPFIYFRMLWALDLFCNVNWCIMPQFILIERLLAVGVLPLRFVELITVKITKITMVCYVIILIVYSVVVTIGSKHGYSLDAAYENSYTKCGDETVFEYDCITKGGHCIFEIVWNRHLMFAISPEQSIFLDFIFGLTPVYINIFGCLVLVILLYRKSKKNKMLAGKKRLDLRAHLVVIVYCVDFCVFQMVANPLFDYLTFIKDCDPCGMDKFKCDIRLTEFGNSILLVSSYLQCVYPIVFSSKFRKALLDFFPAGVRDFVLCNKCHQCKSKTCAELKSTEETQGKIIMNENMSMHNFTEESTSRPHLVAEEQYGYDGGSFETTEEGPWLSRPDSVSSSFNVDSSENCSTLNAGRRKTDSSMCLQETAL